MKAKLAIERTLHELAHIAAACNGNREYEAAATVQRAIVAVDDVNNMVTTNLEAIDIPDDHAKFPQTAVLQRTDAPHLRDAIRWLDDVPSTNGNYPNAQAVRTHLQAMMARIPRDAR